MCKTYVKQLKSFKIISVLYMSWALTRHLNSGLCMNYVGVNKLMSSVCI